MNGGKSPGFNDLDSFTGEFTQPISLNLISNKKVWHCPLGLPSQSMFSTIIDKSKSKDCNDYIFENVNPELKYLNQSDGQRSGGRNDILKFQVLFNMN